MMSSAFGIGTLLSFITISSYIVSTFAGRESILVGKAINLWVTKTFVSYFTEFTLPPTKDVASGIQFYCHNEELNFEEIGKSGFIYADHLNKLSDVVNTWTASDLISSETSASIGNILKNDNFRTILQAVHIRKDGQLIYGTFGFIELTKTGNSRSRVGTILYSFKKLELQAPTVVTFDINACILWGAFCPASFKVDWLSDIENRNLFSYIHFETIKTFVEQSGKYLENLDKESLRYRPFLPQTLAVAVTIIEQNVDKVPTDLFTEDPFVIKV